MGGFGGLGVFLKGFVKDECKEFFPSREKNRNLFFLSLSLSLLDV